jgi:hypothetical protein
MQHEKHPAMPELLCITQQHVAHQQDQDCRADTTVIAKRKAYMLEHAAKRLRRRFQVPRMLLPNQQHGP